VATPAAAPPLAAYPVSRKLTTFEITGPDCCVEAKREACGWPNGSTSGLPFSEIGRAGSVHDEMKRGCLGTATACLR
jgi:hypothetical protein